MQEHFGYCDTIDSFMCYHYSSTVLKILAQGKVIDDSLFKNIVQMLTIQIYCIYHLGSNIEISRFIDSVLYYRNSDVF